MFGITADLWLFAVIVLLVLLAVGLFIEIQLYMADPLRRQRNEEWFAQFQAYVASRYREDGMAWRVNVIERGFARPYHGAMGPPL
jgi:hypothetical protein